MTHSRACCACPALSSTAPQSNTDKCCDCALHSVKACNIMSSSHDDCAVRRTATSIAICQHCLWGERKKKQKGGGEQWAGAAHRRGNGGWLPLHALQGELDYLMALRAARLHRLCLRTQTPSIQEPSLPDFGLSGASVTLMCRAEHHADFVAPSIVLVMCRASC